MPKTIQQLERPPADLNGIRSIGGCRLLRMLGKGGMSEVYLAYDPKSGQPVAIKMMAENIAHDAIQLERFEREVALTSFLDHRNIVRGLAAGKDPATKRRYLVLEYVDGPSAQLLVEKKQRLEINDVAHIALGIACALQHLHANRFIHRDIKPDNILLSPCGEPKLIDLGLAKWENKAGEQLTATSDGFGTSYYMPFEQSLNAHFVDARSDIFALGATLYHLLTGRVPYPGEDHHEVMRMKKAGHYTPVSMLHPNVPASLEACINRMLALDPRQRYRTADDLIDALESADLTKGLPSYADLGLAVRDPDMGKKDQDEPTRPDLRLRRSNLKRTQTLAVWVLKYKSSRGGWKTRRASTEQVLNALRAKRFSGPVLAARQVGQRFRPLGQFPEFHVYFASPDVRPPEPAVPEPSQSGFCRRVLAKIGLGHI